MDRIIDFAPGDTVRVHQKIREGDKTRTQIFEGIVLAIRGRGENKSFTARKVVGDIAVERIWPINSLNIQKIEVKSHPRDRIRRSKLYFLRDKKGNIKL